MGKTIQRHSMSAAPASPATARVPFRLAKAPAPDVEPVDDTVYIESDGKPMAESSTHFDWLTRLKLSLEGKLRDDGVEAFVGGDMYWFPVQRRADICKAPDVFVALGRPAGLRNSYKQWREGGAAPQVVFEFRSPCNTDAEMLDKLAFYELYGVQEYYVGDVEKRTLQAYRRVVGAPGTPGAQASSAPLAAVDPGSVSPLLGVRFEYLDDEFIARAADGQVLPGYHDLRVQARAERERAQIERERAQDADKRAKVADEHAAAAQRQLADLRAKLLAMGVDPNKLA